ILTVADAPADPRFTTYWVMYASGKSRVNSGALFVDRISRRAAVLFVDRAPAAGARYIRARSSNAWIAGAPWTTNERSTPPAFAAAPGWAALADAWIPSGSTCITPLPLNVPTVSRNCGSIHFRVDGRAATAGALGAVTSRLDVAVTCTPMEPMSRDA